jgi:hydroxymethylglutaryl-CoA reductase
LQRAEVSCPVTELAEKNILNPQDFAERFVQAVQIAE